MLLVFTEVFPEAGSGLDTTNCRWDLLLDPLIKGDTNDGPAAVAVEGSAVPVEDSPPIMHLGVLLPSTVSALAREPLCLTVDDALVAVEHEVELWPTGDEGLRMNDPAPEIDRAGLVLRPRQIE